MSARSTSKSTLETLLSNPVIFAGVFCPHCCLGHQFPCTDAEYSRGSALRSRVPPPVFDLAVVVSDTGAVEAFKNSYSVVRQNISSVLRFSILFNLIGAVISIPGNWLLFGTPTTIGELQNALVQTSSSISSEGILPYVVFLLTVGTVVRAVTLTYRIKFYTSVDRKSIEPA